MKAFIPREKLGKKARRELDRQRRTLWQHSPATKKIESKKLYTRKTKSHARSDDYGMGFCFSLIASLCSIALSPLCIYRIRPMRE